MNSLLQVHCQWLPSTLAGASPPQVSEDPLTDDAVAGVDGVATAPAVVDRLVGAVGALVGGAAAGSRASCTGAAVVAGTGDRRGRQDREHRCDDA